METNPYIKTLLEEELFNPGAAREVSHKAVTAVFASAANRFAQTLLAVYSFLKYHPTANIIFALCDEVDSPKMLRAFLPANAHWIHVTDLDLPHARALLFQYDVYEMLCALKPWLVKYAFKLFPDQPVFYCDGDLLFFSPLGEALEQLQSAPVIITAHHHFKPAMHCANLYGSEMRVGIYNGGFLGFSNSPDARAFLKWWKEALLHTGFLDLERSEFVDQKWLDVVPIFWPTAHILDHPGYNISWWNIEERCFDGASEPPTARGLPVRFFHLSAFLRGQGAPVSRHCYADPQVLSNRHFPFANPYRKALDSLLSLPEIPAWETAYAYHYFSNGRRIPSYMKRAFASAYPWPMLEDPFNPKHYWKLRALFFPSLAYVKKRILKQIIQ